MKNEPDSSINIPTSMTAAAKQAHFVLGVSIGGELPMYGFGFTYSAVFGLFGGPLFGCQADFWAAPAGCSGAVSKQTVD